MWGQLRPVQAASAPPASASGGAGINNSSQQEQQNQTTATKTAASPPAAPAPAPSVASTPNKHAADTKKITASVSATSSADLLANATARSIVGVGTSVSEHNMCSSKSKSESKSDPQNDAMCSADTCNDNGDGRAAGDTDIGEADYWGFDDDPFFKDDDGQGDDVNTTDAVDSNNNPDEIDKNEGVGPEKSPQMQTQSQKSELEMKKAATNSDEDEADDLVPPSSTMLIKSNRRLGASSAKMRSAVTANKKHKSTSSMQPEAKANSKSSEAASMELARQKFAAAVRKIEDDDDNWDFDDADADAGGDGEADNAAAEGSKSVLHEKLVQYISSLSSIDTPLVRSLNSLLEAEL